MPKRLPYQQRFSNRQIFEQGSNFEHRYVPNHDRLAELVAAWKTVGHNIVLTMGSYDIVHIGHFLYLEKARTEGDLLIVGVDSDEKIKTRKGPERPVVPEKERVEMLTHLRHVDVVTLKNKDDERWKLIKLIQPNVLVATQATYTPKDLKELKQYCGKVVVLAPQATTSTTAKIRRMQIGGAKKMVDLLEAKMQMALEELREGR